MANTDKNSWSLCTDISIRGLEVDYLFPIKRQYSLALPSSHYLFGYFSLLGGATSPGKKLGYVKYIK